MDQRTLSTLTFPSKQRLCDESDPINQTGHALATLPETATLANDNVDRAMTVEDKLSIQLRAAEDRIAQLQTEVERLQNRAIRAERRLQRIKKEMEDKLISPMEVGRRKLPVWH
jgi:predicted  nucleic acid-binding Zn-ribbon protein